ncbi:MAG: hypothetical protein VX984_01610 [Thermodesulfobacteriota bacterium]|nr:hypothetical protein [Thermodesulfobacteriota bacterium]
MSYSDDFVSDFNLNHQPLRKATLLGIWKENHVRRLIYHHKINRKVSVSKNTLNWIED